jgi:hypothetical protein
MIRAVLQSKDMTARNTISQNDGMILTNVCRGRSSPKRQRTTNFERSEDHYADIPISCESTFYTRTRVSKRDNRSCCITTLPHPQYPFHLLVLGNELLDRLDVLLLGVGRAQALVLSPLVVLRLAL